MNRIRVLLVDDQALVRSGFAVMLSVEDDIEVVGQAGNGREAVEFAASRDVDVVLMDVQMPELDGIEATEQIVTAGRGKVVILTTFERDDYLFDALRAGASGFLLKNADPDELVGAVHAVAEGHALLAPEMTVRVIEKLTEHRQQDQAPAARGLELLERLTEREREVLQHMARGLSNAEIARTLFLSETTVKTHVSNLLGKIQTRDRVQAVVFAYESGLVRAGE
ncbi:transcriptional regulator [Arthrobacter pigmenti]